MIENLKIKKIMIDNTDKNIKILRLGLNIRKEFARIEKREKKENK